MDLELTLDAREAQGKANKRLRREGLVPGVVYGKGEDSTNVQVDAKTFETLYRTAGRTSVVKFRIPGHNRASTALLTTAPRRACCMTASRLLYRKQPVSALGVSRLSSLFSAAAPRAPLARFCL